MRAPRRLPAFLAVAVLTTLAAPLAAEASAASRQPAVRAERPRDPRGHRPTGRLQVRFKPGVGTKAQDAALARVRAKGHGVGVQRRSAHLNAVLVGLTEPKAAAAVQRLLRQDPAVAYAEAESTYEPMVADPQSRERNAASLPTFAARDGGTAVTGAGTEIAVVDSAVDTLNPDLVGKVTVSEDLATADIPDTDDFACDPEHCPHGTAVAAVAAGADDNGGVLGAAPDATIASYNVFRRIQSEIEVNPGEFLTVEDLRASSFDIANALDAVRARAIAHPELVAVNMSLGGTFDNQLVRDALADLRADAPRVTVVVAAGNDGGERASFPAGDPGVVSVGASGQVPDFAECGSVASSTAWTVTSFSNRGDVDLLAPGRCITTWYRPESETVYGQYEGDRLVEQVDGTSFAAPMVAGVVALLASTTAPVTGDAARAALLAGADVPATPNVAGGVGSLDAAQAIGVATGSTAYTAAFVERGGQLANVVGRRNVEVLQVQPGVDATAPAQVTPTVTKGALTTPATATADGVRRSTYLYVPPATNQGVVSFTMNGAGPVVPMRLLDAADNFEGLPIANGEATSVPLTYGTRSAYIRSFTIGAANGFRYDYTYGDGIESGDPDVGPSSDLFVWEPASANGVADAAMEPFWQEAGDSYVGSDAVNALVPGRHLIGWLTFSAEDDSDFSSRYEMKVTYPYTMATANAPELASAVSSTGPFVVSWNALGGTRYDVEYTTKVKVGTSWVVGTWKPWLTHTAAKSATFGASNLPVALAKGQTYHFRVRAYDGRDAVGPYRTDYTVVPLDDAYYAFAYAGTWGKGGATGRWASNVHYSSAKGASLTVKSETSQFTVIGDKCPACGQLQVYVDGVLKATVDTRASGTLVRQSLWTSANLGAPKPHTLKVVVVGTAGRPKVVLDAIGSLR
jgi:subtilisin family serine protease